MMRRFITATVASLGISLAAQASDSEDAATVSRLATSKHTLVEAIRQAEKSNGSVISAKFEYEDGKLWLGVYAARSGRAADAEHNMLFEMKGEPNAAAWKPEAEVFADKEHLTRSAMQLTLMQRSNASLADFVTQAATGKTATAYSAIPEVKNGKSVVVVMLATPDGKTQAVAVDLR
jgi:hypothetical protein